MASPYSTPPTPGSQSPVAELLRAAVSAGVPLRIAELTEQLRRGAVSVDTLLDRAHAAAQLIAEHGDLLLFRSKKPGESARVLAALIDALAIGALLAAGGSRFLGESWCAPYADTARDRE